MRRACNASRGTAEEVSCTRVLRSSARIGDRAMTIAVKLRATRNRRGPARLTITNSLIIGRLDPLPLPDSPFPLRNARHLTAVQLFPLPSSNLSCSPFAVDSTDVLFVRRATINPPIAVLRDPINSFSPSITDLASSPVKNRFEYAIPRNIHGSSSGNRAIYRGYETLSAFK